MFESRYEFSFEYIGINNMIMICKGGDILFIVYVFVEKVDIFISSEVGQGG